MEPQADVTKSSAKETKLQPSPQVVVDTMSDEALALRIQALPQALQDNILEALENIMSDEALALRIQALPQELQDNILESLDEFQVTSNHVIITSTYKPPLPLQLSRKIRAKFARKYYGNANFRDDPHWMHVECWARGLTAEHREMVARVQRTAVVPYDLTPFEIIDG